MLISNIFPSSGNMDEIMHIAQSVVFSSRATPVFKVWDVLKVSLGGQDIELHMDTISVQGWIPSLPGCCV